MGSECVSGRSNAMLNVVSTIFMLSSRQWQLIFLCKHCKLLYRKKKTSFTLAAFISYISAETTYKGILSKSWAFVCSFRDIFMTGAIIVRFLLYSPGRAGRMVSHPITAAHCRSKSKLVPWTLDCKGANAHMQTDTAWAKWANCYISIDGISENTFFC